MPKAAKVPLSALFAINKPTGIPSMQLLNKLQPLFSASELFRDPNKPSHGGKGGRGGRGGRRSRGRGDQVKMGQGGTLDPLADGVLVVGTNAATKSLSRFLDCTKEYRAIGLVGCSTDSYDSEGKRVRTCSWEGVTRESVEEALANFRGEIEQTPPIYSALKMDGKPLYEYARTNTPLPRPIPPRKVTVHSLELLRFVEGSDHEYEWPKEELDDAAKKELERLEKMVKEGRTEVPSEEEVASAPSAVGPAAPSAPAARPPFFEIRMTVSSGTYVRSIVHDLGIALGSAAHVVKLTRTRQGEFVLDPAAAHAAVGAEAAAADADAAAEGIAAGAGEGGGGGGGAGESSKAVEAAEGVLLDTFTGGCVEWSLLEAAIKAQEAAKKEGREVEGRDADGWLEWERDLLSKCKEV